MSCRRTVCLFRYLPGLWMDKCTRKCRQMVPVDRIRILVNSFPLVGIGSLTWFLSPLGLSFRRVLPPFGSSFRDFFVPSTGPLIHRLLPLGPVGRVIYWLVCPVGSLVDIPPSFGSLFCLSLSAGSLVPFGSSLLVRLSAGRLPWLVALSLFGPSPSLPLNPTAGFAPWLNWCSRLVHGFTSRSHRRF